MEIEQALNTVLDSSLICDKYVHNYLNEVLRTLLKSKIDQPIYSNSIEVFSNIPNMESYQATTLGRIYSLRSNKYLKPYISNSGYEVVSISIKGKVVKYSVHRLIASTFLRKIEGDIIVDHIDGNRLNNNVTNLEWTSYYKNNKESYRTKSNTPQRGEDHPASKLSNDDVLTIKQLLKDNKSYSYIAQIYNVVPTLIGAINRNERRKFG